MKCVGQDDYCIISTVKNSNDALKLGCAFCMYKAHIWMRLPKLFCFYTISTVDPWMT